MRICNWKGFPYVNTSLRKERWKDQERLPATYHEIQVGGRLSQEWAEWFGDMTVAGTHTEDGSAFTVLAGPVPDRAALFGILNRIRDLGLKLISVNQVAPGD